MVIMLKGQNSKTVIERVKLALENMRASLPEGVWVEPFYDQSEVIDGTIRTVRDNVTQNQSANMRPMHTGYMIPLAMYGSGAAMDMEATRRPWPKVMGND